MSFADIHPYVLHLPILTTIFATFFAVALFTRLREKGGGPHLLWWGIGMVTYGIGTFTESFTTVLGWHPTVFRLWYVAGAFLGGYPLAQGSIYLLMNRRFANLSAWIVSLSIGVAAILVFLSPLDVSLAEAHRLDGKVLGWSWLRMVTPFINIYSVLFLAGGAFYSAFGAAFLARKHRDAEHHRNRYLGNIFIAVGAILPAIGGTMTRFGYVEALYVGELLGLLLIYAGYRKCVAPTSAPATGAAGDAAAAG